MSQEHNRHRRHLETQANAASPRLASPRPDVFGKDLVGSNVGREKCAGAA